MCEIVKNKPVCKLVGNDGNVFNLVGIVIQALKRAGMKDKADEFWERVRGCGSYDEALQLIMEYVEVE